MCDSNGELTLYEHMVRARANTFQNKLSEQLEMKS